MALLVLTVLFFLSGCGGKSTDPDKLNAESKTETGAETQNDEEITGDAEMNEFFGCKAQKLDNSLSGKEVFDLYLEELENGKKSGYTPIIVVVDESLTDLVQYYYSENVKSPEEYVSSVLSNDHSDGKGFLDERYEKLKEFYGDSIDNELEQWRADPVGSPSAANVPSLDNLYGKPYLVKVPTNESYNIPAWIPFGGWNDCPDIDDIISVCKYWNDKFGAIPMIISRDTLIIYVERPITDVDEAVSTAKEVCAFCDDFDIAPVSAISEMVYNGDSWYFWWD